MAVVPRRPVRDEELESFQLIVDDAFRARITRADFLPPQVVAEREVLVVCVNPGGVPGKKYPYEPGWLEVFRSDLREGYFLAL